MNLHHCISVCSGAGGMDLGFDRAGFKTVAMCEVDPWRRKLLAQNFPDVPIWPDLTTLDPAELPDAEVLIGGTPCQDLSSAGLRAGLDGERSGLYWDYQRIRLAREIEWCVWENVEGALSSNGGLDFAQVLAAMVGADVDVPSGGWARAGVAAGPWGGAVWRVLDAQHFGVPQRRFRVFVAGHLGGPCPPEVLLELASGSRNPAPREGSWQDLAGAVGGGAHGAGRRSEDDDNYVVPSIVKRYGKGTDSDATDAMVVGALGGTSPGGGWRFGADEAAAGQLIAAPLTAGRGRPGVSPAGRRQEDDINIVAHTLRASGFDASEDGTGRGTPLVAGTVRSHTRPGSNSADLVGASVDPDRMRAADGLAGTLDGSACCVDPRPDSRRYEACGDGVVAPVAAWIGRRLRSAIEAERSSSAAA